MLTLEQAKRAVREIHTLGDEGIHDFSEIREAYRISGLKMPQLTKMECTRGPGILCPVCNPTEE